MIGQAHGKGALDPEQEFRAREAVEPPVALERAVQSRYAPAVRVEVARKPARNRDQGLACVFAGRYACNAV